MKAILLALSLLLVALCSHAQIKATLTADKPFKSANTIIVTLPDSSTAAWKRTAQVLTDNGYAVKASDKDLLTISTDNKPAKGGILVNVSARIQGNQAILRGNYIFLTLSALPEPIVYSGMNGSVKMRSWEEFDRVAHALGGKVEYSKR